MQGRLSSGRVTPFNWVPKVVQVKPATLKEQHQIGYNRIVYVGPREGLEQLAQFARIRRRDRRDRRASARHLPIRAFYQTADHVTCRQGFLILGGTIRWRWGRSGVEKSRAGARRSQADRFRNAKTAAVQQFNDQLGGAFDERDHAGNLLPRHHNRDVLFFAGANRIDFTFKRLLEDFFVQEHQGVHGLILGCGRDIFLHGEMGRKSLDLGFPALKIIA
ncbi:MAG: hypothetical protein AUK55_00420 [Syntrophobacteraceae bacterium CG2_30_61_12]|nr:MAG: hypothetical protein AUK55_00420 [Syntrophobacteraceae bacterium CG2_30_61_12]